MEVIDDNPDEEQTTEVPPSCDVSETESFRSCLLISDLDEISQSSVSRSGQIDYSDLPDLEEVDEKALLRENQAWTESRRMTEEKPVVAEELEQLD